MKNTFKLPFFFVFFAFIMKFVNSIFFDMARTKERCYVDEFYRSSTAIIKWKVFSTEFSTGYLESIIQNFSIKIYNDQSNELLKEIQLTKPRDKNPFNVVEDGYYRVCVELYGFSWEIRKKVFFGLKILSENMDSPNLSQAIKLNDTDTLKSLFDRISHKGESYVGSQIEEIRKEDAYSENVFHFMHTIYFVIFIQVLIVVLLTGYQIVSFRKVLLEHFLPY